MMLRQREAKFGDGHAPIGEQALAERWIDPGSRHDTCPILWIPLLLSKMIQLLDRLRRVHSSRVEGGLNRLNPLLDSGSALYDAIVVRHLTLRGDSSILRAVPSLLAAYHVDLSSTGFGIQEENHFPPSVHEMLPGTPEIRKGYLYGNHKPGLGIDINEEMAAKYPIGEPRNGGAYGTERAVDGTIIIP